MTSLAATDSHGVLAIAGCGMAAWRARQVAPGEVSLPWRRGPTRRLSIHAQTCRLGHPKDPTRVCILCRHAINMSNIRELVPSTQARKETHALECHCLAIPSRAVGGKRKKVTPPSTVWRACVVDPDLLPHQRRSAVTQRIRSTQQGLSCESGCWLLVISFLVLGTMLLFSLSLRVANPVKSDPTYAATVPELFATVPELFTTRVGLAFRNSAPRPESALRFRLSHPACVPSSPLR
ncbi:hypothetical protein VTK73DRAFT_1149 [Phialemonium thermophilum]|uniref:Uncharacterized protein n=1 Tax=Phialemonium thermophilum TaxID=223376 RepID=A0ABR3VTU8_9PEZI